MVSWINDLIGSGKNINYGMDLFYFSSHVAVDSG